MHSEATPPVFHRKDYTPPAFWVDTVDLTFDLDASKTRVLNKMTLRRNPDVPAQPLRLDGEGLNLARVLLNGQGTSFKMDGGQLVLEHVPEGHEAFELEIFGTCAPDKNTELSGLYTSDGCFFTQCEAEGFRRITYFIDRPDVLATWRVSLRADKRRYPVLLSNGNLVEQGDLPDGRHFAVWSDPHKKPSYLFALVAGAFAVREQRILSTSGKEHLLQVYASAQDLDQTAHAMEALIQSVAWDEARFGLALDLERFMVVAASNFNSGAMENKGLNIFNARFVLAKPSTATDADYASVQSVIAHEYLHNWTGNRITCRDWFQLSLKEGLTVFRDQEFSADMARSPQARAVQRIRDVQTLRSVQFAEDAGPLAHPVRPDQYREIRNFYTATVYEKGAEVIRMMHTLLGEAGFRKGMDLYVQRHDGCAVTCDDFAQAMADANPASALAAHLPQFKRWYSQAGTPEVYASGQYDAAAQRFTLRLRQHCAPTPQQAHKLPLPIPVRMGLLGADGASLPLHVPAIDGAAPLERVLLLTEAQQDFVFEQVPAQPVPSLLRHFSAPVRLHTEATQAHWLHLLAHDPDAFNRHEAAQELLQQQALAAIAQPESAPPVAVLDDATLEALRGVLCNEQLDAAWRALALATPNETLLATLAPRIDPPRIRQVAQAMRRQMAHACFDDWASIYHTHHRAHRLDAASQGQRALAALALQQLCLAASDKADPVWPGKALQAFKDATHMTARMAAIDALLQAAHPLGAQALGRFYALYRHEPLVVDKWFRLQACRNAADADVLSSVRQLMRHADFALTRPNRVHALLGAYFQSNPAAFHRADGAGYAFWAEQVLALDALNPQLAARMARALDAWSRLLEPYRSAAHTAIARLAAQSSLSADVREVLDALLQAA